MRYPRTFTKTPTEIIADAQQLLGDLSSYPPDMVRNVIERLADLCHIMGYGPHVLALEQTLLTLKELDLNPLRSD